MDQDAVLDCHNFFKRETGFKQNLFREFRAFLCVAVTLAAFLEAAGNVVKQTSCFERERLKQFQNRAEDGPGNLQERFP